jgi:cobalt-precorrin 5A hydrolase/precorrin-3B C17-methyltransferase
MSLLEQALRTVSERHGIDWETIAGLATVDLKQTEPGLLALSQAQNWPLLFFSTAELNRYGVPCPSAAVHAAIGTASVCEASALKAAEQSGAEPGSSILLVPKQIFRAPSGFGSVTVAIASSFRAETHQESAQAVLPPL